LSFEGFSHVVAACVDADTTGPSGRKAFVMKRIAHASWTAGARSETGYVRNENQDRMSRVRCREGFAYIVSDGMGGHKGGAEAAELTVRTLERHLSAPEDAASIEETIREAFVAANASVYEAGHLGDPQTEGMGATAVVCVTTHSSALVAHVGDSRAYLHRGGHLTRLTRDHTRAQSLVAAGLLSPADAENNPDASILARAIGQLPTVDVDIGTWLKLKPGDELLLCSDGLCGEADDLEILRVLQRDARPQRLADRLVALALRKGGRDNVTVQLIRYGRRPAPFDWKPVRYQAATLPILALGCAATIYLVDSRMEAHLSKQITTMEAETRALRASADEWRNVSEKKLATLQEEVASLNDKVKELAAVPKAPAVLPLPPGARKASRSSARRHAPTAAPSAKAPMEKKASAEPISLTTQALIRS
jgi:serine/threonine protein phosphatase PrpC